MASNYYPPVGFYFKMALSGFDEETSFQEISGLTVDLSIEEVVEGGELRFSHRLPNPPRYSNLVMKRGLLTGSKLRAWIEKSVNQFEFAPATATIQLLDPDSKPLMVWVAYNVRPAKWEISPFHSGESREVAIESLELAIDYFATQQTAPS